VAIYEITKESLLPLATTTFSAQDIRERYDLQRLLRAHIEAIAPDTYVLAEEYGEWEDSKRRIDLLCIDKEANLVVVELKRSEDGGHMDLQAIRYAAMVSTMTFTRAVETHATYLQGLGKVDEHAQTLILDFLGWGDSDERLFAKETRIVLVSGEFSKEITTAVLWLNDRGLDIRCVRLRPYSWSDRTLLDIQQVIPLPEAAEYQVQLRRKEAEKRQAKESGPWNGEYYVSFGHDPEGRSWEDAVKYGFVSGGGGSWYTQTLRMLEKGSRIWVNVPREGYVGVGLVEETSKPINEFSVVNPQGKKIPILAAPLKSPGIGKSANDPEQSEHLVRVRWIKTVPVSEAISEKGFFGNQNTVARPTAPKWDFTIQRLRERFGISDQ
jgi:hypothetical protein